MGKRVLSVFLVMAVCLTQLPYAVSAAEELTELTGFELLKDGADTAGTTVSLSDALTAKYYFSFSSELLEEVTAGSKYGTSYAYDLNVPETLKITETEGASVPVRATVNISGGPVYSDFILGYLYFSGGKAQYYFAASPELTDLTSNYEIDIDNAELAFSCMIDESKLAAGDKSIQVQNPFSGNAVTLNILERQDIAPEISDKTGEYRPDSRSILWTVNAHTGNPVPEGLFFEDTLNADQTYKPGTFKVNGTAPDSSTVSYSERVLTYTPHVPPAGNTVLEFTYETDVTSLFTDGNSVRDAEKNVTNSAEWKFDGGSSAAKNGAVNVKAVWLEKEATGIDLEAGIITWRLIIRSNGSGASNVIVYDQMADVLSYKPDSLFVSGNTVTETAIASPVFSYNGNPDYHGISFSLNSALSSDVTITYETTIDPEYLDTQNSAAQLENKVWMTFSWDPGDGSGYRNFTSPGIDSGASVPTSLIKKDYVSYNYEDKEITWHITVNANRTGLKNAAVTDLVPEGQVYVRDSAKIISRNGAAVSADTYLSETYDAETPQFEVSSSSGALGSDTVIIELKTLITDTDFIQYNKKDYSFLNRAELNALFISTNNPVEKEASAQALLNNEVIKKTSAGYDYGTQIFTWEIIVNQNNAPLENVLIEDEISLDQTFREDSGVNIERISGNKDSSTLSTGYLFSEGKLKMTIGAGGETIHDTYRITYYTVLNADNPALNLKDNTGGSTRTISNTAVLTRSGYENEAHSASRDIQNILINKSAGAINTSEGNVTFTVSINQNRTLLSETVITDILPAGLLLDLYSVRLYEASVSSSGAFVRGAPVTDGFTRQYNASSRTLTVFLPSPSDKAYQLVYVTDIIDASKPLNNIVSMGHDGHESAAGSGVTLDQVNAGTASGQAKAKKGRVSIKKVDASDNSIGVAGTAFGLYDTDMNLLQEEITGPDGTLVFENLTINADYIIKETSAAGHYAADESSVYQFKVVSTTAVLYSGQNYTAHLPVIKNERSHDWTAEFRVSNQYMHPLSGAVFGLYDSDGNEIKRFSSLPDGLVRFTAPFGSYEVREISAPPDCGDAGAVFSLDISIADPVNTIIHPVYNNQPLMNHVYTQGSPQSSFVSGSAHELASGENLVIEVNKDLLLLKTVKVGGTVLSSRQYSVDAGGGTVTLSESFLSTLPPGEHILVIEFSDGTSAEMSFFVEDTPEYVISASAGENGSVSPDGESSVKKGGRLAVAISPDPGYRIKDVYKDGEAIDPKLLKSGTFAFENVQEDHTLYAEFETDSQSADTGDRSMAALWMSLALMSGLCICAFVLNWKMRREI